MDRFTELTKSYYHKDATCIKCGSDDILDTYLSKGEETNKGVAQADVIDRNCDRCTYSWAVLPVDHENYPEELRV